MVLVSLISAVSLFVGGITGAIDGLAVALAALWGFGGGLLVALGPASTQIGLTSMVMLVVFAAQPLSPTAAAEQAGLILAGGLLQTLLAVAAWPVRRDEPQRVALAALCRQLAADTRASRGPDSPPPATAALTDASATVTGAGSDHSAVGEAWRTLLDEAEGINLALLALDDTRHRRRDTVGQGTPPRRIDAVMNAAGDVLALLAEGLDTGRAPADTDAPLQRIAASARALRSQATHAADGVQRTRAAAVLAGVEALASQLRAAVESTTHAITGDEDGARLHAPRPPALRPRAPVSILRANLTLRSAACCFALADALGRTLDLPRGYWVPMTVAIILKPDFAATFTHGLGATVGLVLATGLVYSVFGEIPGGMARRRLVRPDTSGGIAAGAPDRCRVRTHAMTNRGSGWATDEPITQAIEREIQAKMQPGAPPIDVSAQGGSVTLTGQVANQATKEALIALARSTDGIVDDTANLVI